jgi:hypothetical protein
MLKPPKFFGTFFESQYKKYFGTDGVVVYSVLSKSYSLYMQEGSLSSPQKKKKKVSVLGPQYHPNARAKTELQKGPLFMQAHTQRDMAHSD